MITIGLLCIISVLSLQRSYLSYLSCLDLFSYKLLKDFNFNQEDMHFYLFFYFTWSWKQWTYHLLIRFVKIVYWDKKKSISEFSSHPKQSSSPFINPRLQLYLLASDHELHTEMKLLIWNNWTFLLTFQRPMQLLIRCYFKL